MIRALILSFLLPAAGLKAQETGRFFAQAATETIVLGNYVQIAFVLENGTGGKFTPPDWEAANCTVVAGPSQSSVISYVNGKRHAELKYVYYIAPRETGKVRIPPAKLDDGSKILETAPLELKVVANPDGTAPPPGQQPAPIKDQKPLKSLRPSILI